jgi:hypothetical protein
MWIMTSFGVLMPSIRPAETIPLGDDRVIQVRVRVRKHLEILRDEYMKDTLSEIVFMKNTDYEYRAYCTRAAWAQAMAAMSLDIDYTKFKPTTERYKDGKLHSFYNRVWSVFFAEFSTPEHQRSYWQIDEKKWNRGLRSFSGKTTTIIEEEYTDVDTSDVDGFTEGPDLMPNGRLDHTWCAHSSSNTARKRCRRRWRKSARV